MVSGNEMLKGSASGQASYAGISPLDQVCSDLEKQIARSREEIGALRDRLGPVLGSGVPAAGATNAQAKPAYASKLANNIAAYSAQVGELASELRDIQGRLDL